MCDSAQSRTLIIVNRNGYLALENIYCIYNANFYELLKMYKKPPLILNKSVVFYSIHFRVDNFLHSKKNNGLNDRIKFVERMILNIIKQINFLVSLVN